MIARSPHEAHRVATPLELFFDLVFVVAIARAAAGMHHAIAEQHAAAGLLGFAMVFFAIWWAWMNFTWFASAYDCDDVPYRLATFVQITGALILAAGITRMFEERHLNLATVGGYAVMRVAAIAQWLRAARADPDRRVTTLRYAGGIGVLQVAWVGLLFAPTLWTVGLPVLILFEVLLPAWAESAGATTWHRHHIAERYGLFTIIVLGESILAATIAIEAAWAGGASIRALMPSIVGGLLIVFSMWWIYFDRPAHRLLTSMPRAFLWGYGHYFVFGAAAAVGAGLAVTIDQAAGRSAISAVTAGLAVTIPVVLFLLTLWVLHYQPDYQRTKWLGPAAAPLILASAWTGYAVVVTGVVLAVVVAIKIALRVPARE
jgi:low temperature requirement protein LtrA